MQIYEGLPIITNKMTLEERCGIQHHFLGVVPKEQEIRVGQWEGGVRRVVSPPFFSLRLYVLGLEGMVRGWKTWGEGVGDKLGWMKLIQGERQID